MAGNFHRPSWTARTARGIGLLGRRTAATALRAFPHKLARVHLISAFFNQWKVGRRLQRTTGVLPIEYIRAAVVSTRTAVGSSSFIEQSE
jgi:hypothetical protein